MSKIYTVTRVDHDLIDDMESQEFAPICAESSKMDACGRISQDIGEICEMLNEGIDDPEDLIHSPTVDEVLNSLEEAGENTWKFWYEETTTSYVVREF